MLVITRFVSDEHFFLSVSNELIAQTTRPLGWKTYYGEGDNLSLLVKTRSRFDHPHTLPFIWDGLFQDTVSREIQRTPIVWYLPVLSGLMNSMSLVPANVMVNLAAIDTFIPIIILDEGTPGFSELKDILRAVITG